MTPAHPWRRLWAGAAALGVAATLCGPRPVAAAPLPGTDPATARCGQAQRYAAQAGAELLRLNRLDLRPLGRRDAPVTEVGLAAGQSAMVAQSVVNSAAASRLLDAAPTGRATSAALTRPVYQQAAPTNPRAAEVAIAAGEAGPLTVGTGRLSAHARWQPGWACAATTGEITRVQTQVSHATILRGGDEHYLVRVPQGLRSVSTTALRRRGGQVDVVAQASVTATRLEVLDGAVRIRFVRPPTLSTTISAATGSAEVRYLPPVLEVSGRGIATQRLESPGDAVTVPIADAPARAERAGATDPLSRLVAAVRSGAPGQLGPGSGLFPTLPGLPPRPGVPAIADRQPESAPNAASEPQLRISLGDVRQATSGHAVAARASAVRLEIVTAASPANGRPGGQVLDLGLGVLESASVAPDREAPQGGAAVETSGRAGGAGLPVTGPTVDLMLLVGGALLLTGSGFLLFGLRRASPRR